MTAVRNGAGRLIVAALLTGLLALGLVALGWWLRNWEFSTDRGRFLDPSWWAGLVTTGLGHLAFGKVGLKIALVAVGAVTAGTLWARGRRGGSVPSDAASTRDADGTTGARPDAAARPQNAEG
ncbi:hypothetical protein [Micromonospora sagamiensis]|uniref:Uncharacterized protein n=1 Tax=Micromonospora sagamiensis TaxID=47875 RepID=A0A562WJ04_9ACTN|nr:hypothetical protein [Micromonospora sagamiensis]TWJ30273.1 hypothetical protein JD81_03811 [Micromonospora sagamiensis]BCL16697.1 hypothetical protein GCM10017556_44360 [Micromonospora sagamiensis]